MGCPMSEQPIRGRGSPISVHGAMVVALFSSNITWGLGIELLEAKQLTCLRHHPSSQVIESLHCMSKHEDIQEHDGESIHKTSILAEFSAGRGTFTTTDAGPQN